MPDNAVPVDFGVLLCAPSPIIFATWIPAVLIQKRVNMGLVSSAGVALRCSTRWTVVVWCEGLFRPDLGLELDRDDPFLSSDPCQCHAPARPHSARVLVNDTAHR